MTDIQKQRILNMWQRGISFSEIADTLGLPKNTVKTFCWRNQNLICDISKETDTHKPLTPIEGKDHCANCSAPLEQRPKQKPRRFCDDSCRYAYWRDHRDRMNRKAFCPVVCAHCGQEFDNYGSNSRKYCCHPCYIAARYYTGGPKAVAGI